MKAASLAAAGLIISTLGATRAYALPRPCPVGFAWDNNQGSCIKKKVTPRRSPATLYYRGLDLLNGTKKRRARPAQGLRLLRRACTRKFGQACTTLGFLYLNGRHVKASNKKSLEFYAKACKLKDSNGCIGASQIYSRGLLGKIDHAASIPLLESACKLKQGKGCYELAVKYDDALGTKANPKRARELFKKAAALLKDDCPKNGPSCHMIGVLYKDGRGVPRDYKRAFEAFKAGCDARSGAACFELGNAYKRGYGTPRNPDRAQETFHRACHSFDNAQACHAAGVALAEGDVKAADRRRVMRYGERACQLDKRYCDVIAYLYGTGKGGVTDHKKAVRWYKAACTHGNRVACYSLAARHYYGNGTTKDMREAVRLYQRSCDQGYGAACTRLGLFYQRGLKGNGYELSPDTARAYRLFLVGCVRRHGEACYWVAYALEYGKAGLRKKPNLRRARIYYLRACRYDSGLGCSRLGYLYEHGRGGARNPQLAVTNYRTGCRLHSWSACQRLGYAYYRGLTGQKDLIAAADAFTTACKYGASRPCDWIDRLYKTAGATEAQRKRALGALQSACSGSSPNERACYNLALLFANGGYIANKKPHRAFNLFNEACTRNYQNACVQLGHMYRRGIGVTADPERAKKLFRSQCNGNAPASCAWLGVQLWAEGKYAKAVPLFKRACDVKNAVACNELGVAYYTARGTTWNILAAKHAFERGCELSLPRACANMGVLYEYGVVVKPDPAKALENYDRGCTPGDSSGCGGLARFYQRGLGGVKVDLKRAETEFTRSCNDGKGEAESCRRLADIYRKTKAKPQPEIERLYLQSLSMAQARAKRGPIGKYALAKFYRDGVAVVRNPAKALELFAAACNGYEVLACVEAGKLLMAQKTRQSYERAAVRFSRACAANMMAACARATEARSLATAPIKTPKPKKTTPKLPTGPRTKRGCGCSSHSSGDGAGALLLFGLAMALSLSRKRRTM